MSIVVPTYTRSGLPSAGTAGSLALLTDDLRGLWIDSGVQWFSITGQINVKDFGARGDGSNDDTVEIQAALDAVPAGGATVFFPPGTYLVSDPLTPKTGTVLRGSGKEATRLQSTSTETSDVVVRIGHERDRVTLEHIRVSCHGYGQRCVEVAGAQECTFRDVWFTSDAIGDGVGLWVHSAAGTGSYSGNVIACLFDNLQLGARLGEISETNPGANVWEFFGCKFTSNTKGLLGMYATNVNVVGCRFELNTSSGVEGSDSPGASLNYWLIVGGYFESNGGGTPLDIKTASTCDRFTLFWNYGSGGLDYVNNGTNTNIYQ